MRTLVHGYIAAAAFIAVGCGSDDGDPPTSAQGGTGSTLAQAGNGGQAAGAGGSDTTSAQGGSGGTGSPTGGAANTCAPSCGERSCGPDPVCGESCGTCDAGLECVAGECRSPAPLRENGETCSTESECASGICGESQVGESRCYGDGAANDVCGDVYDCLGGLCLQKSLGASQLVCVPGVEVCWENDVSDECASYTVAFCQLIQFCGDNTSSNIPTALHNFDYCVGSECLTGNDGVSDMTPAECLSAVNFIDSGTAPCP